MASEPREAIRELAHGWRAAATVLDDEGHPDCAKYVRHCAEAVQHLGETYFPADDPDLPARLAGPEAVALLRKLQWSATTDGGAYLVAVCPVCRHSGVHASDCQLDALAALARARGEVEP